MEMFGNVCTCLVPIRLGLLSCLHVYTKAQPRRHRVSERERDRETEGGTELGVEGCWSEVNPPQGEALFFLFFSERVLAFVVWCVVV